MDGITILNVTEVSENCTPFIVVLIVLMIGAIINTAKLLLSTDTKQCVLYGIFVVVLFALLIGVVFTIKKAKVESANTQYECLIDKSVSIQDVYEKYTVIERRGDIWVLEDKEK